MEEWVKEDGRLFSGGPWVEWDRDDGDSIALDGHFTVAQLEFLVIHLKANLPLTK